MATLLAGGLSENQRADDDALCFLLPRLSDTSTGDINHSRSPHSQRRSYFHPSNSRLL